MNIEITAWELIEKWLWKSFCDKKSINERWVKEELIDKNEKFVITDEDAMDLWLIKKE